MARTTCESVPGQSPLATVSDSVIDTESPMPAVLEQSASSASELNTQEDSTIYTFTWKHPASEVFVTGTFDDWSKSIRLDDRDGFFEKTVLLPKSLTRYKFVVDGNWMVDPSKRTEADGFGIVNNLLLPEDITIDRWMAIQARAARRKAQLIAQQAARHNTQCTAQRTAQRATHQESDTSGDESIEQRVARIKARVVELTSEVNSQPSDNNILSNQSQHKLSGPARASIPHLEGGNLSPAKLSSLPTVFPEKAHLRASLVRRASSVSPTDSIISTNPKLDRILSSLCNENATKTFNSHGISDVWLPISKKTVHRLLADTQVEKEFLRLQEEALDKEIHTLDRSLGRPTEGTCHASIDDDEDIVNEHRILGEGACGIVEEVSISSYSGTARCVRKKIGRPMPLKAQKKIMEAFAREISVMRQVDNQHCVQFLASYTDFDHVNILSSPVADMDLATFLDRPINQREREILYRGFGCLCGAINYLHQNNIRHEDLKPQNVLIHGDNILLTDFGFSLDFSDDSMSTTTGRPSAWTIRYSAPEVLDYGPRNRATDIWSLGCVLFEMVFGFYGTSLSNLKDRWKSIGNGQPSFARNMEAVNVVIHDNPWPDELLRDTWEVWHLYMLVRIMLAEERLLRPTAQQIIDRLSDISVLISNTHRQFTTACRGPEPCIGLSNPVADMVTAISQVGDIAKFAQYIFPWCHKRMGYGLWDLEGNPLFMSDGKVVASAQWAKPIYKHHYHIRAVCKRLYDSASRTGATKAFWESHQRGSGSLLSDDGKRYVLNSAYMLNLKHVVSTRVSLRSRFLPLDESEWQEWELRPVQVTLLPICHPRSSFHGSFFYMLSWSVSRHDEQVDEQIIDLTI
jgi:serine/threonine protein kinase